ncbi:glycosyltransferase, partial [Vibrio parahaemolyticus]
AWQIAAESSAPLLILEDNCDLTDEFFEYFKHLPKIAVEFDFFKAMRNKPKEV